MKIEHAAPLHLPGMMGAVHRSTSPTKPLLPAGTTNPTEKTLRKPKKKMAFTHPRAGAAFMK
jgi:hypothetical protein